MSLLGIWLLNQSPLKKIVSPLKNASPRPDEIRISILKDIFQLLDMSCFKYAIKAKRIEKKRISKAGNKDKQA